MLAELRKSLYHARRKGIAVVILTTALMALAGVLVAAAAVIASLNPSRPSIADVAIPATAQMQSTADGLLCLKSGRSCRDFDSVRDYMSAVITEGAEFRSAPATQILTKSDEGWQSWAASITDGISGVPTQLQQRAQTVTFRWGPYDFTASFTTSGNQQRLQTLTRGNNATSTQAP